jgi:hypothetical protein
VEIDMSPPRSVNWASRLLVGVAVLGAAQVLNSLLASRQMASHRSAFEAATNEQYAARINTVREALVVAGVLSVVAVLGAASLVTFVRRPRPAARIVAWVFCAFLVAALLITVGGHSNLFAPPPQELTSPELQQLWRAMIPGWYLAVHYLAESGTLVAGAVAGFLLTRPEANDFYRSAFQVEQDDPRLWTINPRE